MSSTGYPNPVSYQAPSQARRPLPPPTKTIPFDYVFQFSLKGERDNRVQDVVEISMEGVFVALSLGYSVVLDEQRRPRTFQPVIDQRTTPPNPVLVPFFPASFPTAQFDGFLVAGMPESEITILGPTHIPAEISFLLQARLAPPRARAGSALMERWWLGSKRRSPWEVSSAFGTGPIISSAKCLK